MLAGQKRPPRHGRGSRRGLLAPLQVACGQRLFRLAHVVRRGEHVDLASLGQVESIAAERAGEDAARLEAALREQPSQLADDPGHCLLPGRRTCLSPERLREFVLRNRSTLLRDQVGEYEAALPSGEPRLVDAHAFGFQSHAIDQEDLQARSVPSHPLTGIFPPSGGKFVAFAARESFAQGTSLRLRFRGAAEEEGKLIEQVQRHALRAHGMTLSREHVLLLAFRAQLDETAWPSRFAAESADEASRDGSGAQSPDERRGS